MVFLTPENNPTADNPQAMPVRTDKVVKALKLPSTTKTIPTTTAVKGTNLSGIPTLLITSVTPTVKAVRTEKESNSVIFLENFLLG
jgi:hypothetical protein